MNEQAQELALEIIRPFEGCHLTSYILVSNGVPEKWATVGYGRAIPLSKHPMTITQEQADKNLLEDIKRKDMALCSEIPASVLDKLTVDQYAAVLSFRYNVKDSTWLAGTCSTRLALKAGRINLFTLKLKQWNKGEGGIMGGLVRRRKCERYLLLGHTMSQLKQLNFFIRDFSTDNLEAGCT